MSKEPQVFGNTLYSLRGSAILAGALSLIISLVVFFAAPLQGTPIDRAAESALFGLGIFALIAAAILPTCLFSIRIDETRISHWLLGRFLLSSKPLAELRSIVIGEPIGAILTFADGTKIRFLGARVEFLRDLCGELRSRCGNSLHVEVGAQLSGYMMIGKRPKRKR